MFASIGDGPIRGSDCIRRLAHAEDVNLKRPDLVRSTNMRKYFGTVLQLKSLNAAQLDMVLNHMGHSKKVHFDWYRQTRATSELSVIAQFLCGKSMLLFINY